MKRISSRDNPVYKRALRLAAGKREPGDHDARPGHQLVIEGVHLCQAWLEHMGAPVLALFDAEKLESNPELMALAQSLDAANCVACDTDLARRLSQVGHAQGVYFVVLAPQTQAPVRIEHDCIWLDRVQDPGNAGTLLRTSAAAGIRHAYLSDGCASAWSGKVLRSAQGAHFVMAIYEHVDLVQARSRLAIPLLATALEDAGSVYDCDLSGPCAWLMGNEGQGVDPLLLASADKRVFIPQDGRVESLNVAVAAGICLFEQRRQRSLPGL